MEEKVSFYFSFFFKYTMFGYIGNNSAETVRGKRTPVVTPLEISPDENNNVFTERDNKKKKEEREREKQNHTVLLPPTCPDYSLSVRRIETLEKYNLSY